MVATGYSLIFTNCFPILSPLNNRSKACGIAGIPPSSTLSLYNNFPSLSSEVSSL